MGAGPGRALAAEPAGRAGAGVVLRGALALLRIWAGDIGLSLPCGPGSEAKRERRHLKDGDGIRSTRRSRSSFPHKNARRIRMRAPAYLTTDDCGDDMALPFFSSSNSRMWNEFIAETRCKSEVCVLEREVRVGSPSCNGGERAFEDGGLELLPEASVTCPSRELERDGAVRRMEALGRRLPGPPALLFGGVGVASSAYDTDLRRVSGSARAARSGVKLLSFSSQAASLASKSASAMVSSIIHAASCRLRCAMSSRFFCSCSVSSSTSMTGASRGVRGRLRLRAVSRVRFSAKGTSRMGPRASSEAEILRELEARRELAACFICPERADGPAAEARRLPKEDREDGLLRSEVRGWEGEFEGDAIRVGSPMGSVSMIIILASVRSWVK